MFGKQWMPTVHPKKWTEQLRRPLEWVDQNSQHSTQGWNLNCSNNTSHSQLNFQHMFACHSCKSLCNWMCQSVTEAVFTVASLIFYASFQGRVSFPKQIDYHHGWLLEHCSVKSCDVFSLAQCCEPAQMGNTSWNTSLTSRIPSSTSQQGLDFQNHLIPTWNPPVPTLHCTLRATPDFQSPLPIVQTSTSILSHGPHATVILTNVIYRRDACLPTYLHIAALLRIPCPINRPGVQQVHNVSWCNIATAECWFNATFHQNFCTTAKIPSSPLLDDEGGHDGESAGGNNYQA